MYIAEKIVEKCENSKCDWRRGASGNRTMKIKQEYYDSCGKRELIEEIIALEKEGLLSVKWIIRGSDVEAITFRTENLPRFYELQDSKPKEGSLNFQTKQEKADYYIRLIKDELAEGIHLGWIRDYYDYLLVQFQTAKSFPKETDKLSTYVKCFRGIDEIIGSGTIMYKRVFSKKYIGNSKTFEEEAENHIASTVKKYWDEIDETMDKQTILEKVFIKEYAQELEVKGPLHLEIKNRVSGKKTCVNIGDFSFRIALDSEMLENSRILPEQPEIRKVMTIENKANFVFAPYDEHTLYIFSHGYLSPKERDFLIQLQEVLEQGENQVEYLHSGDLDYGGIKIFEYEKKRIFPKLKPYQMDVETFDRYIQYGEPIKPETLEKIKALNVSEFSRLIDRILETGKGIEQESFLI